MLPPACASISASPAGMAGGPASIGFCSPDTPLMAAQSASRDAASLLLQSEQASERACRHGVLAGCGSGLHAQERRNLGMLAANSGVERRAAVTIDEVEVGSGVAQCSHDPQVAQRGSDHQGRASVTADCVYIVGGALERLLHELRLVIPCRLHERGGVEAAGAVSLASLHALYFFYFREQRRSHSSFKKEIAPVARPPPIDQRISRPVAARSVLSLSSAGAMLALLQEVVPIMVASGQNLQANELMRLVSCCRVLRATLQNLELDLSARPSPAPRLLQFIALNAARFQLVSVNVDRCTQEAFDALLLVPGLRALTVRGPASSIRSLAGAERARSLQTLRLLKGVSVALADDLSPLAACRPLTHLCLYGPAPLTSLGPLACCARLESLDLRGCEALVDVEPLVSAGRAACHGLRSLSLRGCRSLRVVSPLRALLALESLDLSCTLVSDVSMLCECPKLKTLTLTGCASLSDVAPLVGLDGECEISRWAFIA